MKRVYQIATAVGLLFLCVLMGGCGTVFKLLAERHWNLGICREAENGSCGCAVKVPKRLTGVGLYAKVEPKETAGGNPFEGGSLRFRIQNRESRTVDIAGLGGRVVFLNPGESTVLPGRSRSNDGMGYLCSLDTSRASMRLSIEVLGKPPGTTIHIVGYSTDSL